MSENDDSTIDLSNLDEDLSPEEGSSLHEVSDGHEEFRIHHLDPAPLHRFEPARVDPSDFEQKAAPTDKVKVRFDKFITLVATHTYEDVLRANAGEEVIISTNLLTDLANAHEDGNPVGKKIPFFFVIGIVLGVIVTYFIVRV